MEQFYVELMNPELVECVVNLKDAYAIRLFSLSDAYIWLLCSSMRIKEQTSQRRMLKTIWPMSQILYWLFHT